MMLATGIGCIPAHRLRGQSRHVERPDQVDLDDADKARKRVRRLLAEHSFAVGDAGAVDKAVYRTEGAHRRGDRGLGASLVGDIGLDEFRPAAQLGRERIPGGLVEIG
jgi:hypothetical protein